MAPEAHADPVPIMVLGRLSSSASASMPENVRLLVFGRRSTPWPLICSRGILSLSRCSNQSRSSPSRADLVGRFSVHKRLASPSPTIAGTFDVPERKPFPCVP